MLMKLVAVFLFLIAAEAVIAEDDDSPNAYFCTADYSTGFAKKNGQWRPVEFKVTDDKYILRRPNKSDIEYFEKTAPSRMNSTWVWVKHGEQHSLSTCKGEKGRRDLMHCQFIGRKFSFNFKKYVFQVYSAGDYVLSDDPEYGETTGTPYIEIGKCTAL